MYNTFSNPGLSRAGSSVDSVNLVNLFTFILDAEY